MRASLVRATMPFAVEDRSRTWSALAGTVALFLAAFAAGWVAPGPIRALLSVVIGGLIVRLFIFVHDAEHGAIFRGDPLGRVAIAAVAALTLNALPIWRKIHDHHHHHNAEPLVPPLEGAYPGDLLNRTVTVEEWRGLPPSVRRRFQILQHPLLMVFGFFTVFLLGNVVRPLVQEREWRGLVPLALWSCGFAGIAAAGGWDRALWLLLVPNVLSSALGVYLFYAQHHFPDAQIRPLPEWSLADAALNGSSFMDLPRWMHWFTGNIGYHHVHHVNHRIPFYRLPEAMAALPELQSPRRTDLSPRQIAACLRCNVWDPAQGRMVSFAEASS